MMNELEKLLCKGVEQAFESYDDMTDEWLDHAPEHYLQNAMFIQIGKQDFELYLEATYKKIVKGERRARLGRPPKHQSRRYDLIVWNKSSPSIRAVVEVKRSWSLNDSLRKDAERIKAEKYAGTGYLVVYTDIESRRGDTKLLERFRDWEDRLGLRWLNEGRHVLGDDAKWTAGFALFRAPNSN